ncbi:MAG: 50S ribosomal protein L22 [Verrucomicrobia bacterium]|nr:50S ribosomal protein L22 [Verrucomicrobiota bacterium]
MEVRARSRFQRLSASKARPLARRLRGLPVAEALALTQFSKMKAAQYLGKALKSAIANAQNNADLSVDALRVKDAIINEGPRMKRHWPRARGSASPIHKRMCHLEIVLTDGVAAGETVEQAGA